MCSIKVVRRNGTYLWMHQFIHQMYYQPVFPFGWDCSWEMPPPTSSTTLLLTRQTKLNSVLYRSIRPVQWNCLHRNIILWVGNILCWCLPCALCRHVCSHGSISLYMSTLIVVCQLHVKSSRAITHPVFSFCFSTYSFSHVWNFLPVSLIFLPCHVKTICSALCSRSPATRPSSSSSSFSSWCPWSPFAGWSRCCSPCPSEALISPSLRLSPVFELLLLLLICWQFSSSLVMTSTGAAELSSASPPGLLPSRMPLLFSARLKQRRSLLRWEEERLLGSKMR